MENFVEQPSKIDLPVFLIRANYYDKDANDAGKLINDLYEQGIVSVNVRDRNGSDDEYLSDFFGGKRKKQDPKKQYIHRFKDLVDAVQDNDVIVVAHFVGKDPKIGLIKKESDYFCKEEKGEIYKLYCMKMEKETVKCISSAIRKRFLSTLVPANVTITPIIKKQNRVRCMYDGTPIPFKLSSISDSSLEKLCAEYLNSRFSYQSVIVLGGSFPDIDIIGYKNQNELFAAQVSRASDENLIDEKKKKLLSFTEANHKIMFSTLPTDKNACPLNINIQEVWDYFAGKESYKKFLELLIEL